MRRSILQAGAWTAFGLVAAIAVVSASSNHRRADTAAPAAKASVATASAEKCTTTDACCARATRVAPASFASARRSPQARLAAKTARPAGVHGLVVGIDPESGELGLPTPSQMAELEAVQQTLPSDDLNRSDVGLTKVVHPNGMLSLDLEGRFQEFGTISRAANGELVFGCAQSPSLDVPVSHTAPSALEEK